ncbi:trypsin-like serine protease [Streptomyces sp. M19]
MLHLRTPVRAEPVRIASTRPADNTPVRIMGWGMTCEDGDDPGATHAVAGGRHRGAGAVGVSGGRPADRELCVGSRDGGVAASNMDSGGPALVREDGRWALAGVVSGPGGDRAPTLYTDVTRHADWINGIIDGTDVPPDDPIPNVEGAVELYGCVAPWSAPRLPAAGPGAVADQRPLRGGRAPRARKGAGGPARRPRSAHRRPSGLPRATAHADRLVYATMTGTDIALYQLDTTYARLRAEGAKVFRLASAPYARATR